VCQTGSTTIAVVEEGIDTAVWETVLIAT
jgi:hypothetical protein